MAYLISTVPSLLQSNVTRVRRRGFNKHGNGLIGCIFFLSSYPMIKLLTL